MNDYNIVVLGCRPLACLPLPPKAPGPSRLIDLSLCCFLGRPASPLIVRPFVPAYSRAYSFIFSARCLGEYSVVFRGLGDIDLFRMRFRVYFNRKLFGDTDLSDRWGVGSRFTEVFNPRMLSVYSDLEGSPRTIFDQWDLCDSAIHKLSTFNKGILFCERHAMSSSKCFFMCKCIHHTSEYSRALTKNSFYSKL